MVETSSALGGGQQTAALELPNKEHQPDQSSNVISEFVGGVWQGAVTNKVNGVTQLFGADVKVPEVKRSGAAQVAHTAGEVTGDLIDFVIMSKFAGKAIGKFAPQIASTGRVGEVIANNPIGRHMAIGGSVGLVNGAILTPTKEGESGWNRVGRGVTDMATFVTLSGVATKLAPMAEGTGFMGRLKVNGYSGAAAGVVNSQLDAWTHGRQAGVGETLLNTLAWTGGNIAFGEAFHGFGKLGAKYFPNYNLGETNLAGSMKLSPADEAAIKEAVERFQAGRSTRNGSTAESVAPAENTTNGLHGENTTNGVRGENTTNGVRGENTTVDRVGEVRAAHEHDGHSHGKGDPNFKSVVEEGDVVDLNAPRRIIEPADAKVVKDGTGVREPIDGTRGEDGLRTMRVAVAPKDGKVENLPEGEVAETTNTRRVEIEKEPPKDGEVAEAKDRVKGSVMLEKGETLSMREMFERNPEEADKILAEYMTKLEKAFPLEGEIESAAVYKDYLTKKGGTWDMVVLRDKEQQIMGGIQYQIIDVNGKAIGKAAWGEHIWLDEAARNGKNFYTLLGIARENITKNGGEIVFMEFNNPDKMSIEQMLMDEAAGLSAKDREKIWGRTGIHVLVDSQGKVVEYGQPAMSAEDPPVLFLSLGFISTKPLGGTQLPAEDYLKLINAAHRTIPSVNVETDPTVKWIHDSVKATGEENFTFVPLNALAVAREAALKARQAAMQQETAKYIAKLLETPEVTDAITKMVAENRTTPEALRALVEKAVWEAALKGAHKANK